MNKEEIKKKLKLGEYRPKISTENLYLVKFYKYERIGIIPHQNVIYSQICYKAHPLNTYTLAHEDELHFYAAYTKKQYESEHGFLETGDIFAEKVSKVVSNVDRISYKDAEEILETRNTLLLKK